MNAIIHRIRDSGKGDIGESVATPGVDPLDAAYHTVHTRYPGGVPALAARMQMNANTLQNKLNPNNSTHHLTLREAQTIMAMTDDFGILHSLSCALDHVSISVKSDPKGVTVHKVMAMTKEFGDVLSVVGKSTAKGSESGRRLSRNEMLNIQREAGELIGAINALVSNLRGQMADGAEQ